MIKIHQYIIKGLSLQGPLICSFFRLLFGIGLISTSLFMRADISLQDQSLRQLKEDFKKYRPNAPWITEAFMKMSLHDFGEAFNYTMKLLTVPTKRWFYFTDSPDRFNEDDHWDACLWQCAYYEQWMKRVAMDPEGLIYKEKNKSTSVSFAHIIAHIEKQSEQKTLTEMYYQFYAFYSDCLAHFFCEAVYACYSCLDDAACYKSFLSKAKTSLNKMRIILSLLKKSHFFATYKTTLDNYKNILTLLEKEKTNMRL